SVLNQVNDTSLSKSADGKVDIKSRCYPSEFNNIPPVDETKAIPFELVFEGNGTRTAEITLAIPGSFITVKRGTDGSCVDAIQHNNSAIIALGISNAIPQQQATVYYLVPDNLTAPASPPLFTVTATLQDGTALTTSASSQLQVLPLMYLVAGGNIRRTQSTEDTTNIIRPLLAYERVRVLKIEGEGEGQWARVEFDPKPDNPETQGWINIGHLSVQETFIGLLEWAPKQ
ncbi:MAG: hypothetical protein ACOYLB_13700, partial [Phototrophicaceae bacterium]